MTTKEMASVEKGDWVLAALLCAPLDRIRLMQALFLFWYESGKAIPGFFEFKPYTHGPCSLELYDTLNALDTKHLIGKPPFEHLPRAKYHVTRWGRAKAAEMLDRLDPEVRNLLRREVSFTAETPLLHILKEVYRRAPEFAERAIVRV